MSTKKPTQSQRLESVEFALKDVELMLSSLIEGKPDPPKPAPTFTSTMLSIAGISAFLILSLCGLKYITSPAPTPVYNVHNETTIKQTTDNRCWILCKPGSTDNNH